MKKRILSVVLVLMLMLSLLPTFSVCAEAAGTDQAKAVVEVALGYASSGKSIGVMCAGMVSKAANEAGVGTSQIPKATIASPFVGTNQFGFIDSSGNLKYGCKAYTWKDFANGSYTPQTGDLVFYGYMKSGGGTASKTITQVAKSRDYYHTHVGIIRNDDSTMSKLYTVDGGQNSSSDTSHYTYVKTTDRKIKDTNTGYAWTSNSKKIYVMEFVRPNYKKDYNVELLNNYSGKNYMPAATTSSFDNACFSSRDTSVATITIDSTIKRVNNCDSLKISNYAAGASGKDFCFVTYAGGRAVDGAYGSDQTLILSFWAKASNQDTKIFFRWGYEASSAYRSVTLTDDWAYYTVKMNRTTAMNYTIHPYVDRVGTVWISELQLEEGDSATAFFPEDGGTLSSLTASSGGKYAGLPTPSRTGYTFDGWFTKPNGGSRIANGDSVLSGNIRLYAHWIANAHIHTMEFYAQQDATCLNAGNVEYWFCTDCGNYYLDADATNETTAETTILPALGHNYVNGICTRCSAKDPNAAEPDPNAAVVSVVPVRGKAGETVEVAVTLENNPGFSDLSLEIGYETDVMELTKVTPTSAVGCSFTTSQQLSQLPYMLNWVEGTKNNTFTGTLVTLTFQIKKSAALGSHPVTVSYYKGLQGNNVDGGDVNYNLDFIRVPITYVNGNVTVYSYTPGDLNGDDKINTKDVVYLLRYIAGWSLDGLVEDALDVNGDGKVNSKDAVHLLRYIAGWSVTLH